MSDLRKSMKPLHTKIEDIIGIYLKDKLDKKYLTKDILSAILGMEALKEEDTFTDHGALGVHSCEKSKMEARNQLRLTIKKEIEGKEENEKA